MDFTQAGLWAELGTFALLAYFTIHLIREITKLIDTVKQKVDARQAAKGPVEAQPSSADNALLFQMFDAIILLLEQVNELHTWHNTRDPDGVFTWQIRESSRISFEQLHVELRRLNDILEKRTGDDSLEVLARVLRDMSEGGKDG